MQSFGTLPDTAIAAPYFDPRRALPLALIAASNGT